MLAFFTVQGFGSAVQQSGLSSQEVLSIIASIAREGKTDLGRLAALKLFFERAEFVLRLERILPSADAPSNLHLHVHNVNAADNDRLTTDAQRIEAELRRELTVSTPTVDADTLDITDVTENAENTETESEHTENSTQSD